MRAFKESYGWFYRRPHITLAIIISAKTVFFVVDYLFNTEKAEI